MLYFPHELTLHPVQSAVLSSPLQMWILVFCSCQSLGYITFWLKVCVFRWKTITVVLVYYKMTNNSEKGKQCRREKKSQCKKSRNAKICITQEPHDFLCRGTVMVLDLYHIWVSKSRITVTTAKGKEGEVSTSSAHLFFSQAW